VKVPLPSFGASPSPGEVHLEVYNFSLVAIAFIDNCLSELLKGFVLVYY
jgi:hypothetical protein